MKNFQDKMANANSSDPLNSDPSSQRNGNALSSANRHENGAPESPRTLADRSHQASPASDSQNPYRNSRISNLDLEKGDEGSLDQNGDTNNRDHSSPDNQEDKDPNLVDWTGPDDPENPQNWKFAKKARITIALGIMTLAVTFASSVFSTATIPVSEEFGISTEVSTLGTSLFVLGFAVGPVIWGPGSELLGRTIPLFLGYAVFVIFQVPVAVAQNVETIMLCRFLGGAFSCAPLAIGGAILADIWDPVDRGVAICVWSCSIVCELPFLIHKTSFTDNSISSSDLP